MGKNYCELNHITFEKLDELVVFAINQQLKQMRTDLKNLETQIGQRKPEVDSKITRLQAKIERNTEYRKRAYEQLMDEILSKEEFLELKQMYENENRQYQKEHGKAEAGRTETADCCEYDKGMAEQF